MISKYIDLIKIYRFGAGWKLLWLSCILVISKATLSNAQKNWSQHFPTLGTMSSPRMADLNGDGVLDVVIGCGKEEFIASDTAYLALDGKDGSCLWYQGGTDQAYIAVGLLDINLDGTQDIIGGGRGAQLIALDGTNGEILWEFLSISKSEKARQLGWYNFYNPQIIPDQNNDGLEDILISNGGDIKVAPYDPDRPAGFLMVIDARNGEVLAKASMPDGHETYMSVAACTQNNETYIIYGTGGETIGGHLYITTLKEILAGDLSHSIELDSSYHRGYIAPPVWVDLNQDRIKDIAALSVNGKLLTYDGKDFTPLWSLKIPDTEAYSSLAVGKFNQDQIPDFFISIAAGIWPDLNWNRQYMISGDNGTIEFADSMGFYQTSTAVVVDANQDGIDEVMMSLNYQEVDSLFRKFFYNALVQIDFKNNGIQIISPSYEGHNLSSTPWIGDMDQDGFLDIIYVHGTDLRHTYSFKGMQINRLATEIQIKDAVPWGAYMGSNYNGVFNFSGSAMFPDH